jgi:hypothetical protein
MSTAQSVSLIRVTDDTGVQLVFACVPQGSSGLVCVGEQDSWTEECKPITSVIADMSGVIQLTNAKDVAALSAWLGAAAVWLKTVQLEEDLDDERDDL